MPSPFPGMDPYLEGDLWTPFQSLLVCAIAEQLTPALRAAYVALPEKRHYPSGSGKSDPIPHAFTAIRRPYKGPIVTCIEIISPAAKNAQGVQAYGRLRDAYLSSSAN